MEGEEGRDRDRERQRERDRGASLLRSRLKTGAQSLLLYLLVTANHKVQGVKRQTSLPDGGTAELHCKGIGT